MLNPFSLNACTIVEFQRILFTHIVPEICPEFGELVQFKQTDPFYVFHFSSKGVRNSINSILENISFILILQWSYSHLIMLNPMIVPTFNPELYYARQLRGNTHYPISQSGRGLGSRLFSIVKSMGAPLLKDVILPTVKQEAGQVLKDIMSSVGIKRALKQAGKSILKCETQRIMQGKERICNSV